MTANEIYKWPPVEVTYDIHRILEMLGLDSYLYKEGTNKKVEIRTYVDHNIDGERYIEMFSVWFNHAKHPEKSFEPIMIVQVAGRGGRDHREHFITDALGYTRMVAYIRSLLDIEEESVDTIDPDKDMVQLTEFYGISAHHFYDPKLEPKYKEGDIVIAKVIKDHLKMKYSSNPDYVETRCEILTVFPKDPSKTYHMRQLDRRWETEKEKKARGCTDFVGEMVEDKDNGGIGAEGNDNTILQKI